MCEEQCMREIWAGYPSTVQLSLDQLYMFTFMHPFGKNHQELIGFAL